MGFDFSDSMSWTPSNPVNTSVVGMQSIIQVIGLSDPIGSFALPGAGEERVEIVTSWAGTVSATTGGRLSPLPVIDFTQKFSAPDMAGSGSGFTNISTGVVDSQGGTPGTEFVTGETQSNGDASTLLSFF